MQSERSWRKHSYQKGKVFGRLTLTGKSRLKPGCAQLVRIVEADCECGNTRWYLFSSLIIGDTKSCGCLRRDVTRKKMTTHGLTNHPLYDVYHKMLDRCFKPNEKQYKDYGGRGIGVCEEWQENFTTFFGWAMANGWEEGKSIDRINNDKGYDPRNCRIVGRSVQSRNTRRNRMFTAFGETKCLFDWGKDPRCKLTVWGLRSRIDKGWRYSFEQALTEPPVNTSNLSISRKTTRMITAFGETKGMSAWVRDSRCAVKLDAFRDRLEKGWEPEKAISFPARIV